MPTPTHPTYEEAIAHISALIPELFAVPGQPRRKFSLAEIALLSAALGNPHQQFPSVLIAGTNGKGSTASTLASIAHAAGLKVGLYTSPHLDQINERIRLNGQDIPNQPFADTYFRVFHAAEDLVQQGTLTHLPSFFEILTALAFLYFAEEKVDLAILEVGMGGRLDATNLADPLISVITDISLDHQEWLGNTIAEITREKAGILRPNGTLVTLPQHPEANQAIGEAAVALNVRGISATDYMPGGLHSSPTAPYELEVMGQQVLIDSPLKGHHQHRNIALAIATAVELAQTHHFPITPAAIAQGIQTTNWPARFEILHGPSLQGKKEPGDTNSTSSNPLSHVNSTGSNPLSHMKGTGFSPYIAPQEAGGASAPEGNESSAEFIPEFILDVAHNPAGAWALRSALSNSTPEKTNPGAPHLDSEMWDSPKSQVLIFACLRDKPLREMTQILFPLFDHILLAPIHSPRATDLADMIAAAEATGIPATSTNSVHEAIAAAIALHPGRIVISGSLYLVGEARTILLSGNFR